MERRRSSRRIQNKSGGSQVSVTEITIPKKRKSKSPEKIIQPKSAKLTKTEKTNAFGVNNENKSSSHLEKQNDIEERTDILENFRRESIEKCVAASTNLNLSSDSESDSTDDEAISNKSNLNNAAKTKLDPIDSFKCSENNKIDEESKTPIENTAGYFDFTQILSKQTASQTISETPTSSKYFLNESPTKEENQKDSSIKGKTVETLKSRFKNGERERSNQSKTDKNIKTQKRCIADSSKVEGRTVKSSGKRTKQNETKNVELNAKDLLALGEGIDASQLNNIKEDTEETYEIPDEVEITLNLPNSIKKKKKGLDVESALRRRLNLIQKENQVLIHKVHLLCLISHGFHLNRTLNSESLIAIALSIIPSKHCYPPKHADISYLEQFIAWFNKKIKIEDAKNVNFTIDCTNLANQLMSAFGNHTASNRTQFVLMFIVIIRSLGLKCRLLINLQPETLKLSSDKLLQINTTPKDKTDQQKLKTQNPKQEQSKKEIRKNPRFENKNNKKDMEKFSKYFDTNSSRPKCLKNFKKIDHEYESLSDDNDSDFESPKTSKRTPHRKSSKNPNSSTNNKKSPINTKSNKKTKSPKIDRRILSTDSESGEENENISKKKKGMDIWCEVFLEAEEKWISVDITTKRYHCVAHIYACATHPVSYILAWNNSNTIKDLTKRYAPQWLTLTQKLRIDADWWRKTLRPYKPPKTIWEQEEDEELEQQLKDQPLPLSVAEYKNHPLYVLAKDLLKYQAIHPPDVTPVGFFRGEKVYPRTSVVELHTRETWLKEARVVRLGETPFKIVKARLKKDKFGFLPTEEKKSELFGVWQTEDYIPPTAQNGIVPRNSFGNVDLYLESMLPKGTVHLHLPQLQRIARKLNIDCAPAMVGFEPCRFGSRPVMDGWVVCEEFRDVLLDAWNQEFDEKTKAENEKKRKRAKANWRKLFRCLRVKKRLQDRYSFNLESQDSSARMPKDQNVIK